MTEPTIEQLEDLERRLRELRARFDRTWSRQEGEIHGLYDRLQEAHQENARIWRMVPACIQKLEIQKATTWECTDGPTADSVTIHAECDFRGSLSVATLSLNLEGLDRLERSRRVCSAIQDLQRGIVADQFRIHKINESDLDWIRRVAA